MSSKTCSVLLLAFGLAACGGKEPPAEPKKAEGREETKNIRNLDNIGVSGSAIANKVDGALNANDESARKLREQVKTDVDPAQ